MLCSRRLLHRGLTPTLLLQMIEYSGFDLIGNGGLSRWFTMFEGLCKLLMLVPFTHILDDKFGFDGNLIDLCRVSNLEISILTKRLVFDLE